MSETLRHKMRSAVFAAFDFGIDKRQHKSSLDKLGLDHHSWHSVRRRIAQDKYDAYRGSGMTRMDALSKVSLWLNHGPNRQKMVKKSYVANIW